MTKHNKVRQKRYSIEKKCKQKPVVPATEVEEEVLSESPFVWMNLTRRISWPPVPAEDMLNKLNIRLSECHEQAEFRFTKFSIRLAILFQMYEIYQDKFSTPVIESLKMLENDPDLITACGKKDLFSEISDAVNHIIASCKQFIQGVKHPKIASNTTEPAVNNSGSKQDLRDYIKDPNPFPINDMDNCNQAAIYGIKTGFFIEFGYDGAVDALHNIDKALNLDTTKVHWHFLRGRSMSSIRHFESHLYGKPSNDEFKTYENISKKATCPEYILCHAEILRESAETYINDFYGTREWNKNSKKRVDRLFMQCNSYYVTCLKMLTSPARLKFRIAEGFMRLPPPFRNLFRANEIVMESLKSFPTYPYGHLIAAYYCEKFNFDYIKARKHLLKALKLDCANLQAQLNILRLEYQSHMQTISVVPRLHLMLNLFFDVPSRMIIFSHLVSYYIFVRRDIPLAIAHLCEILILSPECEAVMKHTPIFFYLEKPVCLYDVVISEMYVVMKHKHCTELELILYNEFILRVKLFNIDLDASKENPKSIRDKILTTVRAGHEINCVKSCILSEIHSYVKEQFKTEVERKVLQQLEEKKLETKIGSESNNPNSFDNVPPVQVAKNKSQVGKDVTVNTGKKITTGAIALSIMQTPNGISFNTAKVGNISLDEISDKISKSCDITKSANGESKSIGFNKATTNSQAVGNISKKK